MPDKEEVLIQEQQEAISRIAAREDRPLSYYIVTYGCQMNVRDSETLAGMLQNMGMKEAGDRRTADFVLFNTCCVRENAERRALGNVTWLKEIRKENPNLLIAVCGCMIQEPGMAEKIIRQYPFIDLAFGTHNLPRFPMLMEKLLNSRRRVIEVSDQTRMDIYEGQPVVRQSPHEAFITIMYGCNNFCSYCIVPYVRGREVSRESSHIIKEAEELAASGVKDITLLGQNVNSYGLDRPGELRFHELLAFLDSIGIERIRFMTSHPKDISDELIDVMGKAKHVCHALHLPVQHGSNRVLHDMNRRYTREHYLDRVHKLRTAVPDIALSTDIIVGYPGETREEFEETLSLVREVRYASAFTFIYSPRVGTPAARMPKTVSKEEATARIEELIALQKSITAETLQGMVGETHRVLFTEQSRRNSAQFAGKNDYNITVNADADESVIGRILPVRITAAKETTLQGIILE